MEAKVEEDLRRQVASLNHKLDSTLQGGDTHKKNTKENKLWHFPLEFFCVVGTHNLN